MVLSVASTVVLVRVLADNNDLHTQAGHIAVGWRGVEAVYGDATRPEALTPAGVATSGSLILGSAGMANATEVIRTARELNPKVRVLARASYLREVPALKGAGADAVYSGEGEVALAFVEDILESLGATPEQLERERDRAHAQLGIRN